MSLWKTIKIEPALVRGVHGEFLVVEIRSAKAGSTFCVEDPAFVGESFEVKPGDFVELHTRVSQLVSHRVSYAIDQCDFHEQRHLGQTWNFKILYGESQ